MSSLPTLVALLVLGLFAALGLFAWILHDVLNGRRARLRRRIAQVAGEKAPARAAGPGKRRSIQRLKQAEATKQRPWAWSLREQLMQAGLRLSVRAWLQINAAIAAAAWMLAWAVGAPPLSGPLAAAILGFGIPKLVVGFLARRRVGRFTGQFADALDLIVRGIRSGLPLGECINIIGREMPDPLGGEFRLVAEAQRMGLSLQEALDRAVERTPTPDFKYFCIVLAIQQQTGGNLAETLAKLSDVLRSRKRMRDKIKAYSSEATASALIIGSLPIAVGAILAILGPDYIAILFTTDIGHFLLAVGLLLMGGGALVMRKMINFDL